VGLRGLCQHGDDLYLIMEYCPRGTLDVMLHHSAAARWDSAKLVSMVRSIARGMLHLHTRKPPMLHRDLKPGNIFVGKAAGRAPDLLSLFCRNMVSLILLHLLCLQQLAESHPWRCYQAADALCSHQHLLQATRAAPKGFSVLKVQQKSKVTEICF